MKPIFHSVALIAALAGIYFSYDLSKKFEDQQTLRLGYDKENVEKTAIAVSTEKELKDERERLVKAKEEKSLAEQQLANLKAEEAKARREIAQLEQSLQQQNTEFDQLAKAMEEVKKILASLGDDVTFENLPDKVKGIEQDKLAKEAKMQELTTVLQGAKNKNESQKAEVARLFEIKGKRDTRIRSNAMETVITAVNQDWGFVVVGAGSNTGFTPQTKLLVERNGYRIGQLQPTSIEPTQTIAEIEFESLAPGVRLQPGDRVILAEPATN
jgi:predicted RNase H-like nuclease (RuvC/YqgF family)